MIPHYRQFQASAAWRYLSYGIALLVLTPLFVVFASWLLPLNEEHWGHLTSFVIPGLMVETFSLVLGVGLLSWLLGVSLAWILSQYHFWGAGFLRRALIMPFAMPAYVSAFVYVGLLDFSGPLRSFFRSSLGTDAFVPEVRSLGGGIVLLALSLYPYVYVLSFDAFSSQGRSAWEAARSLGASPRYVFQRLALPFARPWIAGGLCLVALEVLNDFGTVSIVGLNTFTTAIYKVWYGFFSPESAAQLSTFLVLIAFFIYFLEQRSRQRRAYISQDPSRAPVRLRLSGLQRFFVPAYAWGVLFLAFGVPALQLALWAQEYAANFISSENLQAFGRSAFLGAVTAASASAGAGLVVAAKRFFPIARLERSKQLSYLGYGIPGAVLAIGIFLPLVRLDHLLVDSLEKIFDYKGGLILTGTIFSMVLALSIRFFAVAGSSLDAGSERISGRLDESAALFGVYGWRQFRLVHWPLLRGSFASGFLLVFVDVVKEMPLTLMTRPFGWDTLSVRIYSLISEGEWQRAAVPALLLVLIGMLPLVLFSRKGS